MRKLLNTLFVLTAESYLTLDGENIVVNIDKKETARFPLHNFEAILCFSYAGASPALMGACAERGIDMAFFSTRGKFLVRVSGENKGNVLLRQEQYRSSDDQEKSRDLAKGFIFTGAKIRAVEAAQMGLVNAAYISKKQCVSPQSLRQKASWQMQGLP